MEVALFIEQIAKGGRTLVVTNKKVRRALTGEIDKLPIRGKYTSADIAHFGNIRGSNEFEDHENVIVLGRNEPTVADAERRAMAIWYDAQRRIKCLEPDAKGRVNYPKEDREWITADGKRKTVKVSVHPDRRVQAVVEQAREAEMLQAIDRLRLIHNRRRKNVYILCNIPLGLPVDELLTWDQLQARVMGDPRLRQALAKCDAKGWDALPLTSRELYRLFPDVWSSDKAAGRWLDKNPPEAHIYSIRVWGVFRQYRPTKQKTWSWAAVRHSAGVAHAALATVLGVPAETILVKSD
jgi:hypothetical protein